MHSIHKFLSHSLESFSSFHHPNGLFVGPGTTWRVATVSDVPDEIMWRSLSLSAIKHHPGYLDISIALNTNIQSHNQNRQKQAHRTRYAGCNMQMMQLKQIRRRSCPIHELRLSPNSQYRSLLKTTYIVLHFKRQSPFSEHNWKHGTH